jgi:cytochrome c peroxidase
LPPDPSNAVADDPAAAALGHKLFFDTRFSSNGLVSCATCHKPELKFTDGLPLAQGVGVTTRKTMSIVGTAYGSWFFWDGRKDSQWSQALGPTESPVEHGGNRGQYAHILYEDTAYRSEYEAVFGPFPDISDTTRFPESAGPVEDAEAKAAWENMAAADQELINRIFVNMGKAIAAYERKIMPGPARFDSYLEAILAGDDARARTIFTDSEANGLQLFIGKAQCINCHNGPLLTNNSFHNTGVPQRSDNIMDLDPGRVQGVSDAMSDPFNCLGSYSDAGPDGCPHVRFARTEGMELYVAFKTPTLRNVADTAPYMHAGQFASLPEVLNHYNLAVPFRGHSELAALSLSAPEIQDLLAFLQTLSAPLSAPEGYLAPPPGLAIDTAPVQGVE